MAIMPENLKSAVLRSDRNKPVINGDYKAFAEHYGCAIYSACVRRPKDKTLVEYVVKQIYRSVYVYIEGLTFHDLNSLNLAIRASLEIFNAESMASREHSRRELFELSETDYLHRFLPCTTR